MKNLKFTFVILFIFIGFISNAQISGTVFRDFNSNGVKDNSSSYNEPFLGGVTIIAYPSSGVSQTTTSATVTGAYSFSGLTFPVRIEFSGYQTGDYSSAVGAGNSSSVQFYNAATSIANFGVNTPDNYCQVNPFMATPTYVSSPGNNGTNSISTVPVGASGAGAPGKVELNSPYSTIGAVWGTAQQRSTNKLFTSSFMKRHASFGIGGTGAIYVTNNTNTPGSSSTQLYVDLQSIGINTGPNVHDTDITMDFNNVNGNPYTSVGKVSLGDMDISQDGKYLFVTNLHLKKLHRIFIDNPAKAPGTITAADVTSWDIPNPCNSTGDYRPWGLGIHNGKVYAGVVCDASNSLLSADLWATIYEMDPNTVSGNFSIVSSFSLGYTRGVVDIGMWTVNKFRAWGATEQFNSAGINVVNPQPILSDIEFDNDDNMIIGIMDRFMHQARIWGKLTPGGVDIDPRVGGDVLKLGKCTTSNTWTIENNASVCGGTASAGAGNNQGPGGGEFFYEDLFDPNHYETSLGGLTYLPSTNQVILGGLDPLGYYTSGFYYLNNTTGVTDARYELIPVNYLTGFGKAGGVGDIEPLCFAPPLEIGNRVWLDTDKDGVQDANETPIQGITVELRKADNTVIATAITDANGNYYFSNATGSDAGHAKYGLAMLMPNTALKVVIPNIGGGSKQTALGTNILTTANAGGSGQPDVRDSDGTAVGTNAEVSFTIGDFGANNHTFDFGFSADCQPDSIKICSNQSAILEAADGFTNYQWYIITGTDTLAVSGANMQTYTTNILGKYIVKATDGAGCPIKLCCPITVADSMCLLPCSAVITATPGVCVPATNQYILTGQVTLTDPPATGTVTVQITGGGVQTFTLPQSSPISYSIAGQTSDGASHTVTVSISGVSCTNNTSYTAPISCSVAPCPDPNCGQLKSKRIINN